MSFFIRNSSKKKNDGKKLKAPVKRKKVEINKEKKKKTVLNGNLDENISSDSELSDINDKAIREYSSEEEEETAQEKRLRLAKQYLEEIEREERERAESNEINRDVIAHRLKEDVLEQAGRLQKKVAEHLVEPNISDAIIFNGHKDSLTCVIVSPDNKYVYSCGKDCTIIKWNIEEKKKMKKIPRSTADKNKGHSDHILCLAISTDNNFLASGCKNKIIHIWNPETMDHIHTFSGHRDAVSGLAFRKNTHQLFSSSFDRSVKIWNLDEMAYVETLFGHQDMITSIDSFVRDRAVTSGGRDGSVRIWKVVEESQLIFNGHIGMIDCVRFINEEHFVSCGDDGNLALWGVLKKKPLVTIPAAHGVNKENNEPNWIISVCSYQNTNLIATGSSDGFLRVWKCNDNFRTLTQLYSIPLEGHINSLQISSNGKYLVAGTGRDHRLGKWWKQKKIKNLVVILPLKFKSV